MRKKKLWNRMVAVLMVSTMTASLLLTGCGKDDSSKDEKTTTTQASQGNKEPEKETEPPEPEIDRPDANTVTAYDSEVTDYVLNIDSGKEVHEISDMLYGIFIEDINFAADGGLYAELIQNRSFEYTDLASGNEKHSWTNVGDVAAEVTVDDKTGSLNENNTNYIVVMNASGSEGGIENSGFLDGISVDKDATYKVSLYAKALDDYKGKITVNIVKGDSVLATTSFDGITREWSKYEAELKANDTANVGVRVQVLIEDGKVALDMISLFPKDTYKGRENGLRKDLAEKLEALTPSFLRFPGGCVIEGYAKSSTYDWKDSIGVGQDGEPLLFNGTYGDVAAREQGINIWTNINTKSDNNPDYMTYGLGFYEYFLLAEDIGAVGVPVLNCGMYCQARNGATVPVGSELFKQYIQDALDLVEFCRGDENTKWGAVRVAMGHKEPFELKYIGIGNENWGNDYYVRYEKFVEAFDEAKKKNPELFDGIEIMYSAGPDDATSGAGLYVPAYDYAEKWSKKNPDKSINDFAGAIDHHYYNSPEWFLQNTDYYDEENYSREEFTGTPYCGAINVFLGEYAAQSNTWKAALAEAAYMTGLERNGDIVKMAAYAPLFGNLKATHWSPDLIWFKNDTSTASVNYYVQKVFGNNAGTKLLKSELLGAEKKITGLSGMVGVGTWNTSAEFDNVKVVNNETGEVLGEQDFSTDTFLKDWYKVSDGNFSVTDGKLIQTSTTTNTNSYGKTGTAAYYGFTDWTDYTYTVECTKTGGEEGFLIPFAVQSADDNYFWNIGGWGNTVSCLQKVSNGEKSDQLAGTSKNFVVETGKTYTIKIEINGTHVKGYIDGAVYIDYDAGSTKEAEAYHVVSTDDTNDIIIKLVNETDSDRVFAVDIANATGIEDEAVVYQVAGQSLKDDNILGKEEVVTEKEYTIKGFSDKFNYTVPKYSVTVIRVKRSK